MYHLWKRGYTRKVSFIDRIYKATTFIPDFSTDDAKAETLNEALTMTILNMIISDEITVEKALYFK